ncbi:MAG: hypothetical protein ACLVIY_09160 [Anaerobutyricum soehngenii]
MKKEKIPYPRCDYRADGIGVFFFSDNSKSTVSENGDSPKVHTFYSNGNVQKKVLSQEKVNRRNRTLYITKFQVYTTI